MRLIARFCFCLYQKKLVDITFEDQEILWNALLKKETKRTHPANFENAVEQGSILAWYFLCDNLDDIRIFLYLKVASLHTKYIVDKTALNIGSGGIMDVSNIFY